MEFATGENHWELYQDKFINENRWKNGTVFIIFPEDYRGSSLMVWAGSQFYVSDYENRKRRDRWVEFLNSNTLPLKEVQTVTAVSQPVFDALCNQTTIESLRMKWLQARDISAIRKLTQLRKLFIEFGSSITDISPLTELENLEVLILGNTFKITDYSCLKKLQNLKVLGICLYVTETTRVIKIESTDFLKEMPNLEYVDIVDTRLINR